MRKSVSTTCVIGVVCSLLALLLLWQLGPDNHGSQKQPPDALAPPHRSNLASSSAFGKAATRKSPPSKAEVAAELSQMPLRFERNAGQWDPRVRYLAQTASGLALLLTNDGAVLRLHSSRLPRKPAEARDVATMRHAKAADEPEPPHELRMRVTGARSGATPQAEDALGTTTNYFIGNDPTRWRTKVANYRRVSYRDIVPGVDLVYHGDGELMEYDFVVAPGVSPAAISVDYEGARALNTTPAGELDVQVGGLTLRQHAPVAYQDVGGQRHVVSASFRILGDSRIGFEVGEYDRSLPLVIDPTLIFASFIGGNGGDYPGDIALTQTDQIVIGGSTTSTEGLATSDVYDTTYNNGFDGFIAMLNAEGTALVFVTYLGGGGNDFLYDVAVDGAGAIVGCGAADYDGVAPFPTTVGAYDTATDGDTDGFVFKLDPTGSSLVFSTFLGGSDTETLYSIDVGPSDAIYVTGVTASSNYPVSMLHYHGDDGGDDAVVTKLSAAGDAIVYSTYLSGSGTDGGYSIAVRPNGNAVIAGATSSSDFPATMSAAQNSYAGNTDVFVAELAADGASLVSATYLGGTDSDFTSVGNKNCALVTLGSSGAVYVAGGTASTDFPVTTSPAALQSTYGGGAFDGYITELSADLSSILYSTYLGGTGSDVITGVDVDASGRVLVTLATDGAAFTPVKALQAENAGGADLGVLVFDAGWTPVFASYYGGSHDELASGGQWTSKGLIAVGGRCQNGFPTSPNASQPSNASPLNACALQISLLTLSPANKTVVTGEHVTFSVSDGTGPFTWSLPLNGSYGSQTNGAYVAGPLPGSDMIRATQVSTGDVVSARVTVVAPLGLSPPSNSVYPTGTLTFTADGGTGGNIYTVSTNLSGATIDAATGEYTAGSTPFVTDTVTVTDSGGHTATVVVVVVGPLVVTPSSIAIAPRGTMTLPVSGGIWPYSYALTTNNSGASIGSSSGSYTAGAIGDVTDVVTITDSTLHTTEASIEVGARVTLTPASSSVAYGATLSFNASGGSGTGFIYDVTTNNSGGSIDSRTGAYQSGPNGGVSDTVTVTDSLLNTSSASVDVAPATLAIAPTEAAVMSGMRHAFAASGGYRTPTYDYTLSSNQSGGSIDRSSGEYRAGPTGNVTDVVRVSDGTSNSATASVTVLPRLTISPSMPSVGARYSCTFTATGGSGTGYHFELTTNTSGGSVDAISGLYTAGPTGYVADVVTVTDSLGNSAMATVQVGPALGLASMRLHSPPGGTLVLMPSGGAAPYLFTLVTNASGATLDQDSGQYTAGRTGSVEDQVQIRDGQASTIGATITVGPAITISPTPSDANAGQTVQFSASGGSGEGYTWALLTEGAGSIDAQTGSYTASSTVPTSDVVIEVQDSLANSAQVTFPLRKVVAKLSESHHSCSIGAPATGGAPTPGVLVWIALCAALRQVSQRASRRRRLMESQARAR